MNIMTVHVFQPDFDLGADHRGDYTCTCRMPKRWHGHDVPETPPEAAEIDARILGEAYEHAGAERVRQEIKNASKEIDS